MLALPLRAPLSQQAALLTVVLLSPIGLDAEFWQLGNLLSRPQTVAHELPGFGSRLRANKQPTMASLADEVAESYEGELHIVGVSMGGMVAQHVCIRHPERVRSAVIACTGARAEPYMMEARADAVERGGMESVLDDTLRRWFGPWTMRHGERHPGLSYARRTLLSLNANAFADGWRAIATHDARGGLGSVSAALTVIAGAEDVAAPPERWREIADLAPRATLIILPGPHMLPLEHGVEFADVVREHLSSS